MKNNKQEYNRYIPSKINPKHFYEIEKLSTGVEQLKSIVKNEEKFNSYLKQLKKSKYEN